MMAWRRAGIVPAGFWLGIAIAGMPLSGCASIDDALFGPAAPGEQSEPATAPAPAQAEAEAQPQTAEAAPAPETPAPAEAAPAAEAPAPAETAPAESETPAAAEQEQAPAEGEENGAENAEASPPAPAAAQASPAPAAGVPANAGAIIRPVAIEPGADTGTSVNHTIAGIRGQLQDLQNRMVASAQQLSQLRAASSQAASVYHGATAQITAHLQIGTTRGNPQLVSQWNAAQSDLDQLSANINSLNAVATQATDESSQARALLGQIRSTFDVPGAVDEDHRQLNVLEDEANQSIIVADRLTKEATDTLQRQTNYVGDERGKLAALANAIKDGSLYGPEPSRTASSSAYSGDAETPGALVTSHFNKGSGDYQRKLYAALSKALQNQPNASFDVVGVSPTRGSAAALHSAQANARNHARDVMEKMAAMGVPASRMGLSSATDPSISASEVRVVVR
jgi:hypothetical protein